jgi:DNA-binding MarR family transcriptional regulator
MTVTKIDSIAENLITIHPLLYKSIAKPMRSQSNITPGGLFVLGCLNRYGILSMSDISKCLLMPKPHVTSIVDRLIDAGFVERTSDPKDRRVVNIISTVKGARHLETMKKSISKNLKTKLSLLQEDEIERLAVASTEVRDLLLAILSKT